MVGSKAKAVTHGRREIKVWPNLQTTKQSTKNNAEQARAQRGLFDKFTHRSWHHVSSLAVMSCNRANSMVATQFELSSQATDAISSLKYFSSPSSYRLLISSWDKHVYLYDTQDAESGGQLIRKYEHRAPVLDVCFGADENEAFSAGMDWQVKR